MRAAALTEQELVQEQKSPADFQQGTALGKKKSFSLGFLYTLIEKRLKSNQNLLLQRSEADAPVGSVLLLSHTWWSMLIFPDPSAEIG